MFSILKGWFGEKLATAGMWMRLDEAVYRRIDDIIILLGTDTTQIDHVLVSIFGVFVIETKNMQGWIFGAERDRSWCQSIYGHKTRFQNPLRQNYRHVECLSEFLKLDRKLFHSVVFFIGECEFKTPMPPNVLSAGLTTYVQSFQAPVLSQTQVADIEQKLRGFKTGSGLTKSDHFASLERRHSSTDVCPKCGGAMVPRVARSSGKNFLGCENFPRCRHTIWPKTEFPHKTS